VCLLLHPLELPEQKDRGVLDGILLSCYLGSFRLFLNDMREDGMVDGEAIDGFELLDELQTHGASDSPVPG
jgi:hypothetical protein